VADLGQIDLAKAEGFTLGPLRVDPPTLQVIGAGTDTLEPRIMQVFVALERRRGDVVSREDLITQCWDGRSVGDDAINRCIARLRRLAEAEGGFAIETIPRVGYRLKPTDPPAPEAALPSDTAAATQADVPQADAPRPWWRSWWAIAAAVAVIVAVASADLWLSRPVALNRVAVLPLQPLGRDEDARVFGAAVAEQIVGVLSDNQIQTVARDEIVNLRGEGRDAAAQKLGADFILDGTVQHTPAGLRVIVHLDRASSHVTLWTGTFDPAGGDPARVDAVSLQPIVAARVVDEITAALAAAEVKDDAAVAAYLKAKEFAREGGRTATMQRHDQMRVVVANAPDFSLGHSGLAWSAAALVQYAGPADVAALRAEARREADRALALNPKNGEAYLALTALAPTHDFGEQERLLRQGLAVEPDEPTLNSTLASLLEDVGRIAEAVPLHERAVVIDPLSPRKNAGFAVVQAIAGDRAQARVTIARAAKRWPNNPSIWSAEVAIESYGDPAKARRLLADGRGPPLEPDFFAAVDAGLNALEHDSPEARARARAAILAAATTNHLDDSTAIELLARIGEVEAAYSLADQAFFAPGDRLSRPDTAALLRPGTAALRRDKRFVALAERLGLVAYWKGHTAPDFCRSEIVAPCSDLMGGR
jgi:DNA-binding winged helix-turn-helix (wHTH) protein/TolB-like protein/Flp pilus assembly protein TadD